MDIANLHALEVKYIGPSNIRGSRVKITSSRWNQSVTIPYNYEHRDAVETAKAYLLDRGYALVGECQLSKGHAILSTTFTSLK